MMDVGARMLQLRTANKMSQGDVEKKTNLLRCYISRCEHGHTVPSLETIQKLCACFGISLYEFFYEGDGKPPAPLKLKGNRAVEPDVPELRKFLDVLPALTDRDRMILLHMARTMAKRLRAA